MAPDQPVTFGAHLVTLEQWREAALTLHDEVQDLTALLRLRTAAMHRVGRTNDHLRTLLANQENQ